MQCMLKYSTFHRQCFNNFTTEPQLNSDSWESAGIHHY